MNFADRIGSSCRWDACGPGVCRDNGWGRVEEGALCLSGVGGHAHRETRWNRSLTRTSTRPPPFPTSPPCPYRTGHVLTLFGQVNSSDPIWKGHIMARDELV